MKIAICVSEMVPFAKTGGLADVAGALPFALQEQGHDVVIIMPYYKEVRNTGAGIQNFKKGVFYAEASGKVKIYFIENDLYFNRDGLYTDKGADYKDNLERFSYFCKRSIELLKELSFPAEIIHCHDWQSALIPVYLKTRYADDAFFKNTKTVFTIHNIGYQGLFPKEEFPKLDLDPGLFNMDALEFYGKINLLKGGIVFSDIITTVSPTYSKEIQTKEFGFGLEGVLSKFSSRLFGILNGIDYSIWNPKTDGFIVSNYGASNAKDKLKNKEHLQKICGLTVNKDLPLFGMISRLVEHKGFDLLDSTLDTLCRMNLQLVILGLGDLKYHQILTQAAKKRPDILSVELKFDDVLAHKIYAGADAFLMPSKYEPCGLGQLISLRYGTIPVVFKTGGLADTVTAKHGFIFKHYQKEAFLRTMKEAIESFANKNKWNKLVENAFACDFSWKESAREYIKLYDRAKS